MLIFGKPEKIETYSNTTQILTKDTINHFNSKKQPQYKFLNHKEGTAAT